MNMIKKVILTGFIGAFLITLYGCTPEVGTKAWCEMIEKKDKGDWSVNEATDYAKHCVFK